jgi:hypothetical protein
MSELNPNVSVRFYGAGGALPVTLATQGITKISLRDALRLYRKARTIHATKSATSTITATA